MFLAVLMTAMAAVPAWADGAPSSPEPEAAPAEAPEVTDAPEPVETPQVTDAPTPVETPEADSTPVPAETPEVTGTPVPAETPEVTDTPMPVETPEADVTPEPVETPLVTDVPAPIQLPETSELPAITEEPEATPEPEDEPGEAGTAAVGDVAASGTCGPSLTWELTQTGTQKTGIGVHQKETPIYTLTISGTGAMTDYGTGSTGSAATAPWMASGKSQYVTKAVIGPGVTSIGSYAFAVMNSLSSVEFQCTALTSIGSYAFTGCRALSSISIPDSSAEGGISIKDYAFSSSGLTAIRISASVKTIVLGAFSGCDKLESIDVDPGSNDYITDASGVLFSKFNEKTGQSLLLYPPGKKAASYTVPDNVKTIGDGAFAYNGELTSIQFSSSAIVSTIGAGAFYYCTALASIQLPASLTAIGQSAFQGCSALTAVDIPAGVTTIGPSAFADCGKIDRTYSDSKTPQKYPFDTPVTEKTSVSGLTTVTIRGAGTSIGSGAFANCYALQNVTLPDSVTSIDTYAFHSCVSLKSVKLPAGLSSIADHTFSNCEALTDVTIPAGVATIGKCAFASCPSLQSIAIPAGVYSIGQAAFSYCGLTGVSLPASLTSIGEAAFTGCPLISVSIPGSVGSIGPSAFAGCAALASVQLPANLFSIGDSAFEGCRSLTAVTFPAGLHDVGAQAFARTGLKEAALPESVSLVGFGAFAECDQLQNLTVMNPQCRFVLAPVDGSSYPACGALGVPGVTTVRACVRADGSSAAPQLAELYGFSFAYPLAAPAVTSVSNANGLAAVTWMPVDGAANYQVLYRTPGGDWTPLVTTAACSYTWPGAGLGVQYDFTVRCMTRDGLAYASDFDKTGKSFLYTETPYVTTLTATADGIHITWEPVDGAVNYQLLYKISGGDWTPLVTTTGDSYTWLDAQSGASYAFTVRSVSADGTVQTSDFDPDGETIAYIAAPKITKLQNTASGIKITWGKVNGAAKYRVLYKTTGDWKNLADTASGSYTWTGAKAGVSYAFTVRCLDTDGKTYIGPYDKTGVSTTFVAVPKVSKVQNVAAGVKITWVKAKGAVNYRVLYKTTGGWKTAGDTTKTSFTWTEGKSGTKYSFTVRCLTQDGASYASGYDKTGKSITYIASPKVTKAQSTAAGVKITWAKSEGAVKYRVFYKTTGSWKKIGDTTKTTLTWAGAKGGTEYTFAVRCLSKDGKSFTSGYSSVTKTLTHIAPPKVTKVQNVAAGVKVTWAKAKGAVNYRVFYKTTGGWKKAGDTAKTSFTWTGAKGGKKYTFAVRCISADGKSFTSGYSTVTKTITHIAAPKVTKVRNTAAGVKITWAKAKGAVNYRVFYKTTGGWKKAGDTAGTSFTWKKARRGVGYTFAVRCISANGKSFTSGYSTVTKTITRR